MASPGVSPTPRHGADDGSDSEAPGCENDAAAGELREPEGEQPRLTQKLEHGKFDAFFMADHLAVLNMPMDALKRSATVTSFEPITLLPALAMMTEHLGLIATGSTTYDAPYHVARRFASLDHISGGRAGWNVVTTSNPDASLNFGHDDQMEHDERYARAREFFDVVTGLWDSWADDAFIRDTERGIYFDPAKMHVLDHKGKSLSARGPLNIARPVQGWPVIVQAGASEAGKQLAAETAEAVFTALRGIDEGRVFYKDVKGRMEKAGRGGKTAVGGRGRRGHELLRVQLGAAVGSGGGLAADPRVSAGQGPPQGIVADGPDRARSHIQREDPHGCGIF